MTKTFTTRRWDCFHAHFRGMPIMLYMAMWMSRYFARALAMPNKPLIRTASEAHIYAIQILAEVEKVSRRPFTVVPTIKLDEHTTYEMLERAAEASMLVKLYLGITTGSDEPPLDIGNYFDQLRACQQLNIPVLLHAESPDPKVDCIDREKECIPWVDWIVKKFKKLVITVEHIGDADMLDYVINAPARVGGGIAYHHMRYTMNDWRGGMLDNRFTCKPEIKRRRDRDAIQKAIFRDRIGKLFAGHDPAPHLEADKIKGASGCLNTPGIGEAMVTLFEQNNALDYLEAFHSFNGAKHYGLPLNEGTMTFVNEPYTVPKIIAEDIGGLVPLLGGETFPWRLVE